jgi:hypothetical protein
MLLVAPQGTTHYENKRDRIFSTVFPKFFPKRNLWMCIPLTPFVGLFQLAPVRPHEAA